MRIWSPYGPCQPHHRHCRADGVPCPRADPHSAAPALHWVQRGSFCLQEIQGSLGVTARPPPNGPHSPW